MPNPGNDGAPLSLSASHLAPMTDITMAADAAVVLTNQSPDIVYLNSTTATKDITTGTGADEPVTGQRIFLYLSVMSGGAYRLAIQTVQAGSNCFMNGLGEGGSFVYNGSAWVLVNLRGSSVT